MYFALRADHLEVCLWLLLIWILALEQSIIVPLTCGCIVVVSLKALAEVHQLEPANFSLLRQLLSLVVPLIVCLNRGTLLRTFSTSASPVRDSQSF